MSDSGWMLASEPPLECLVRLSLRRSRKVFSPLTAPALDSRPPPELRSESGGVYTLLPATVDVSIVNSGWGDLPGRCRSSSTQSAGVGGIGPRAVTPPGGGRLVGGETTGSVVLLRLWDLELPGGGPGGGGGSGIPGSHRVCEADRDLAETGVSAALAEAALLAFGGTAKGSGSVISARCGICSESGCGRPTGTEA
jgi:hypothetical protein